MSLSRLIGGHTRKWKLLHLHRLEVIRSKWVEAAGDYVAQHVLPARLSRKTLRVVAEDAAWMAEMTYLKDEILKRLQELLPRPWVEELKVVAGEPMPEAPPSVPPLRLPIPTEEMRREAQRLGEEVTDPELQQAIERASLARLRRLDADSQSGLGMRKTPKKNGESP